MKRLNKFLRDWPGVIAWALLVLYVVGWDLWLIRKKKPTMSRTYGHGLRITWLGPFLAAVWGGLAWHLTVEEPFQFAPEDNPDLNR